MLYICAKFRESNLERYKSYRVDTISIWKITKGNNSAKKMQVEQPLLIFACCLVMLFIFTKFCEIISYGIKVIEWTQFLY